jgi:acyl-CoA dehydrogenase
MTNLDGFGLAPDTFTDEEEMFRRTVRTFFDRELDSKLPQIEAARTEGKGFWKRAAQAGLVGLAMPERYGGAGVGPIYNIILSYEIGRSLGFATVGGSITTDLAGSILVEGGPEELLREWAPKIVAGAVQCMALTEPDAGSDAAAIRTTAIRDGDDFIINGHKTYISNGPLADIIYLVAKTDPAAGAKGMSIILVPSELAGVSVRPLTMMAFPCGSVGEIHFENVRVPQSNLVGAQGKALRLLSSNLAIDRIQLSARALGQAELAFMMTLEYAKQRKIQGAPIFNFQTLQFKFAEMRTDIETGRALVESGVRKLRAGKYAPDDAAMAKIAITDMSARVVDTCVQIFGGAGFMDEMPISRIYRANRVFRIYGGTSELLKAGIARHL